MEEAERLCDRVGILDHGRLVAEGTRRELVALVGGRDRIELSGSGDLEGLARRCREVPGIDSANIVGDGIHVLGADGAGLLPRVLALATAADVTIRRVDVIEPDLEAVFLHLTGTALRE
jgi:ABC-2 type transport system ATP-binding protein